MPHSPPSTSAPRRPRRITHSRAYPPAVRGPAHRRPGVTQPLRLRAGSHARPARSADHRSHQRRNRRPRRRTRPPGPARMRQGQQSSPRSAAASGRNRPGSRIPGPRADPAHPPRRSHGPARGDPPPAGSGPGHRAASEGSPAHDPPHLRKVMLDADVDLWDVQIAARHADPRTTMRYDEPWRPATSVDSDHTRITGHRRNPDGDEVPEVRRRL